MNRSRRAQLLISLLLVALTLAVFLPVLGHTFIVYDDDPYITQNPNVQGGLSLEGTVWAFHTFKNANWHPLTWISHMLDCRLFGLNPAGHHATSLILHTLNVLLLFLVLDRMTKSPWRSGFVAALFAIHPLHVESVAWIAERKDVLSAFFWMLTLGAYVLYVERPTRLRWLAVGGLYVLGLMAKPMLVTLPFMLLLLDYWPLRRMTGEAKKSESPRGLKPLVIEKLPLFALSGASCVVTYYAQASGGAMSVGIMPLVIRIENALISYVKYMWKMVWPTDLAVPYAYGPSSVPRVTDAVGAALILILITALVIRFARKHPYLPVGWFWYLVTLVPVIGLVQVGEQTMADRYTYIPLIGLSVAVAWLVPELLRSMGVWVCGSVGDPKSPTRPLAHSPTLAAVIVIALLAAGARVQLGYWKDSITLFEHTLAVTKDNYVGHLQLALAYSDAGRNDDAIGEYHKAVLIFPNSADAHVNLAILLYNKGDYAAAWHEVHIAQDAGYEVNSDFLADLRFDMREPLR